MAVTPLACRTSVRVDGDCVVLDGFVEDDQLVLDAMRGVADLELCVHDLLRLGARLAGLATGAGGLAHLETTVGDRLDHLVSTTRAAVDAGVASLADRSRSLLVADDGEVAVALRAWRADLDSHLGDLFDPTAKASVVNTLQRALVEVLEAYGRELAASTDVNPPDSAVGHLLREVRRATVDIKTELTTLTLAVGANTGRVVEHQRTAVKGTEFEPLVLDRVMSIVAPHGDTVEHVGTSRGSAGTKKGDICVTLNPTDAPRAARYVIEAKDRRLTQSATWKELDAAMTNWEATAGIAVFARGQGAPTDLPFWYSDNKAIVVLDRENPNAAPLALACLFARWVVRRGESASTSPDPQRVLDGIGRIQRSLARVATIRRSLSTSASATTQASSHLDELAAEINSELSDLTALLEIEA